MCNLTRQYKAKPGGKPVELSISFPRLEDPTDDAAHFVSVLRIEFDNQVFEKPVIGIDELQALLHAMEFAALQFKHHKMFKNYAVYFAKDSDELCLPKI
jgi:uncharacterized protein DUF6968